MSRYKSEVTPDQFSGVLEGLRGAGHRLLISEANNAYLSALGIDPKEREPEIASSSTGYRQGDLVSAPEWKELAYVALHENRERKLGGGVRNSNFYIDCGAITRNGGSELLKTIQNQIAEILASLGIGGGHWSTLAWEDKKFDDLREKGTFVKPNFSSTDFATASRLTGKKLRGSALAVKTSGGMLLKDLEQTGCSRDDIEKLISVSLVSREHVVICKKSSTLVNRINSKDVLSQMDEQGVKCGICGKRLSQERVDEFIASTDESKRLLDHSRWMAALLVEKLSNIGITEDEILLEFREGTEEVDALVDIDGDLVMVELKDKEFSMGHAYAVSVRIGMYHPNYVLIVTTDKVAPDVKAHFEKNKPMPNSATLKGLMRLKTRLKLLQMQSGAAEQEIS